MQEPASSIRTDTDPALILVDPTTFTLVQASRRVREKLGITSDRLREMTLADLVSQPPPAQLQSLLHPATGDGDVEVAVHAKLRASDGRMIPAELLTLRQSDGEARLLVVVVYFRAGQGGPDASPRLAPGDDAFVEFAGRLGHDLNNLLSTVIGSLGLIREDGLAQSDHEGRQFADDALSASRECADLVDRLMTAAGKQLLKPQRVDVNSIIERLVPILKQTLPTSIDMQVSLEPGLPDLEVDPDRLEAAILDLVVNAREAMPRGGKLVIRSHLATATDQRQVQICVIDAGAGIPDELRNRVLEPLFTTKSSGTGRGLGLSMVNGFVRQSHGILNVDSQPDQGTRVTLSFPPAESSTL